MKPSNSKHSNFRRNKSYIWKEYSDQYTPFFLYKPFKCSIFSVNFLYGLQFRIEFCAFLAYNLAKEEEPVTYALNIKLNTETSVVEVYFMSKGNFNKNARVVVKPSMLRLPRNCTIQFLVTERRV